MHQAFKALLLGSAASLLLVPCLYAQEDQAPVDSSFEARIDSAWAEVRTGVGRERRYADEFFQYYANHPDTKTGHRAAVSAFAMWSGAGAVDEVEEASAKISPNSEVWSHIIRSIGNAYGRSSRETQLEDYPALLQRLEGKVTHPRGRAAVALALAKFHHSTASHLPTLSPDKKQQAKEAYREVFDVNDGSSDTKTIRSIPKYARQQAKRLFREVVKLNADSTMVEIALDNLREMETLNVGQEAPGFEVQTISGERMALSELKGKVVLLEFWATWCGPCRPEIPHLKEVQKKYGGEDFQLVGISLDESTEKLKEFVRDHGMSWPQVQGTGDFHPEIVKQYSALGIPKSYLIDRDGRIAAKYMRGEEYAEEISQLMEKESK